MSAIAMVFGLTLTLPTFSLLFSGLCVSVRLVRVRLVLAFG